MNKKGLSDYVLWWLIFKLGFTIAVVIIVFLIVQSKYANVDFGSRELDGKVIANGLYNSKLLMKYDERIDRLYVGSIDIEKWDDLVELEKHLNNYMSTGTIKYVAIMIELDYQNDKKQIYYDKETYLKWNEYYNAGFTKGSGGYTKASVNYPVVVESNNAILKFDILIPNG